MLKIWTVEVELFVTQASGILYLYPTSNAAEELLAPGWVYFYYSYEQLHTLELCTVLRGKSVIVLNTLRHAH